jgi:hypothetical protein
MFRKLELEMIRKPETILDNTTVEGVVVKGVVAIPGWYGRAYETEINIDCPRKGRVSLQFPAQLKEQALSLLIGDKIVVYGFAAGKLIKSKNQSQFLPRILHVEELVQYQGVELIDNLSSREIQIARKIRTLD